MKMDSKRSGAVHGLISEFTATIPSNVSDSELKRSIEYLVKMCGNK